MKKTLIVTSILALCLGCFTAVAQSHGRGSMGGPSQGPRFDAAMAKLFGENSAFSATMEFQTTVNGKQMIMPGKMSVLDRKSRFEINMADMKGSAAPPPEAMEQMKTMGMDSMVTITRPDQKNIYVAYPGLKAYALVPLQEQDDASEADKFKIESTELGKETVDGHACIKNKVIVTDSNGDKHESTVWNATDLKKFPVKIETTEQGHTVTMLYKDVKLAKPAASLFDPPADFKKYESMQSLMMQEVMKRMGGGMAPMR